MKRQVDLHQSWLNVLSGEFEQAYMDDLRQFLLKEKQLGKEIFPPSSLIFNAFNTTSFDKVKVVILGQDPYHGPGQAHGLSFSVPRGIRLPPSLLNIFKELKQSLDIPIPNHGCLESWAEQGVLLLNACLTVEQGQANAHQGQGWERFTDAVIATLSEYRENLVFMLWGSYAQKKGRIIDASKHLILSSAHPSPLSAYRGFIGNGHFLQTNQYLESLSCDPIDWNLPSQ